MVSRKIQKLISYCFKRDNYFFKLRRIVKKIKYTFVNDQIKKAILKSVSSK